MPASLRWQRPVFPFSEGGAPQPSDGSAPYRPFLQEALPNPPLGAGVIREGKVVSLNRFQAEAAAASGGGGTGPNRKKLMFEQLFDQLDSVDPTVIRRRDRGFKVGACV